MPDYPESDVRFRFSLRALLVVLIFVGVAAGLLGRLYFRNVELFFVIAMGIVTLGPFLMAISTIIWLGLRRGRVTSIPICRGCRCDLRWMDWDRSTSCPKCDVDLAGTKTVQFVLRKHRAGNQCLIKCSCRRQTAGSDALNDSVFRVETLGISVAKRR